MLTFSIVISLFALFVYAFRRNFRRSFYILWTDEKKPDWGVLYQKWYGERWKEFSDWDDRHWWSGF